MRERLCSQGRRRVRSHKPENPRLNANLIEFATTARTFIPISCAESVTQLIGCTGSSLFTLILMAAILLVKRRSGTAVI